MNFLKQAIASQLSHSSRPSRKSLFILHRTTTQSSFYSTTYRLDNPQQPRKPTPPKPQEPPPPSPASSSSTWSQKIKQQIQQLSPWPRPSEIPYQAKVANVVNLIGHIKTPIKFQSTPDGKYFSGAVVSQENDEQDPCFSIPLVFEGDLANVVAAHMKKDDCVYVIGRLSEDPLPFVLAESHGIHVVVENINFVQGFEKKAFETERENDDNLKGSRKADVDNVNSEPKVFQTSLRSAGTSKDAECVFDSWRDLVRNPNQWRDYREQKFKGLVKEKHPDFKHKDDGSPLWLNKAPKWVFSGLERLDFDAHVPKQKMLVVKVAKKEDPWKSLVENPNEWWDNRAGKKNAKAPDFRHKETGDVLWLDRSPDWVLSKLPPLKNQHNATAGKKNMQGT
ncbi:hypothetical protein ACH5RR_005428 [Cinchona calisaya]|uniref:Uncharacterized protein n=1 Tax=Cinchona calisaya TaxID=153742 RepID=A0ABD3AL72_9GENT